MKHVRETAAGKSIKAFVILKGSEHIATVQAFYSDSGSVLVNVWDSRSLIHERRANGGGYDKYTAALRGAVIDGNKIYDDAETDEKTAAYLKEYLQSENKRAFKDNFEKSFGVQFTNPVGGEYKSCFYISGLDRLTKLGYTVIQAI